MAINQVRQLENNAIQRSLNQFDNLKKYKLSDIQNIFSRYTILSSKISGNKILMTLFAESDQIKYLLDKDMIIDKIYQLQNGISIRGYLLLA